MESELQLSPTTRSPCARAVRGARHRTIKKRETRKMPAPPPCVPLDSRGARVARASSVEDGYRSRTMQEAGSDVVWRRAARRKQ